LNCRKKFSPASGEDGRVREPNPDSFVRINPFIKNIENASLCPPGSQIAAWSI